MPNGASASLVVSNEFATVVVTLEGSAEQGPLIRIQDARNGAEVCLDPIELEALTRMRRPDFAVLADPSFGGFDRHGNVLVRADAVELVPGEGEIDAPL